MIISPNPSLIKRGTPPFIKGSWEFGDNRVSLKLKIENYDKTGEHFNRTSPHQAIFIPVIAQPHDLIAAAKAVLNRLYV